ncbi:hypothetical protein CYMTET_52180, partial [Cymbomonas tetramitiformis]
PTPEGEVDESQQQSQAILKFLPFMIGWFSLNVPSGLTLYWFTNNILTTAQTLYLRQAGAEPAAAMAGGSGSSSSASSAVVDVEVEPVATVNPNGKGSQPQMSRKERRELERAEERGKRFAARKAAEKGKKTKSPAEPMAEEESNTSA